MFLSNKNTFEKNPKKRKRTGGMENWAHKNPLKNTKILTISIFNNDTVLFQILSKKIDFLRIVVDNKLL